MATDHQPPECREEFEAWVKNPHMLNKNDSPARWGDCKKEWEANPYNHPWTVGAWEAWKACWSRPVAAIDTGWQPIETAPKNRATVLLYFPGWQIGDGTLSGGRMVTALFMADQWRSPDYAGTEYGKPSHWRELPPAPLPSGPTREKTE